MMWKRHRNITLQMIMERFHYTSIWYVHMWHRLYRLLFHPLALQYLSIDWEENISHFTSAIQHEKCDNFHGCHCCCCYCINDTHFMFIYSLHFSVNGWDINVVIKYTWSAAIFVLNGHHYICFVFFWCCCYLLCWLPKIL